MITTSDPNGHLLCYYLEALWRDNASEIVYMDSYSNHEDLTSPHLWDGFNNFHIPRSLPGSEG